MRLTAFAAVLSQPLSQRFHIKKGHAGKYKMIMRRQALNNIGIRLNTARVVLLRFSEESMRFIRMHNVQICSYSLIELGSPRVVSSPVIDSDSSVKILSVLVAQLLNSTAFLYNGLHVPDFVVRLHSLIHCNAFIL